MYPRNSAYLRHPNAQYRFCKKNEKKVYVLQKLGIDTGGGVGVIMNIHLRLF